ncbi:hypothetical protein [Streptomyces sp. NPDC021020]|uniref:hypothetical protein n=1 Tax=Streptomyces sp. NPDC021020 TaxID=3365109 RepID=UPI00379AE2C0
MTQTFECAVCGEHSGHQTCARCFSRLKGMLESLPEQYVLLCMSHQPLKTGSDGRSPRALHAPLPGRLDVLNLLGPAARQGVMNEDQSGPVPFLEVLAGWAEAVSEERRLTPVRRNVTALVDRLTRHLIWITEQTFAGDFFTEIEELLRVTRRITLTEHRVELLRGVACPSCGMFAMVRHLPGDWAAECRFCPSVRLDQRDYADLVQVQARDADDTVKAGQPDGR